MWLRFCNFVCKQLRHSGCSLRYVVVVMAICIQLEPIICSTLPNYGINNSLREANPNQTYLLSPNHMRNEPPKTSSNQEVYDVENTGRNYLFENYTTVENRQQNIVNNDDEYLKTSSTTNMSALSRADKLLSEITTIHISNENWSNQTLSQTSNTQAPEANGENEFSTEFSATPTQIYTDESNPIDKPDDANVTQKSRLSSEEVLYETLSTVQDEIQDNFFNIENLIGKTSEDPSDYYLEFINKNFINLIDGRVDCRDDDLSASFECLKQTLLHLIRYLTKQRVLKLFDTVHLVRNPEAQTSILQRSFGSDVWNTLATFLRSRILKVTIQGVPRSSAPNIVTTARIVQRGDNSSRFEVGLELPYESEDTDAAEGRESKKSKMKKVKKALMIAIVAKAAALTMAVLGGAVLLAKKAFIMAALSLLASSVTASKKATSAAHTGEYDRRRLGTASYIDLNTGIPKRYDKYIEPLSHTRPWPSSQDYHEQYHPNFINNHERFYAEDVINNSPVEPQFQIPSRYRNEHNNYDAESDWYALTQPEDVQ